MRAGKCCSGQTCPLLGIEGPLQSINPLPLPFRQPDESEVLGRTGVPAPSSTSLTTQSLDGGGLGSKLGVSSKSSSPKSLRRADAPGSELGPGCGGGDHIIPLAQPQTQQPLTHSQSHFQKLFCFYWDNGLESLGSGGCQPPNVGDLHLERKPRPSFPVWSPRLSKMLTCLPPNEPRTRRDLTLEVAVCTGSLSPELQPSPKPQTFHRVRATRGCKRGVWRGGSACTELALTSCGQYASDSFFLKPVPPLCPIVFFGPVWSCFALFGSNYLFTLLRSLFPFHLSCLTDHSLVQLHCLLGHLMGQPQSQCRKRMP
jgi:hypothetical protein